MNYLDQAIQRRNDFNWRPFAGIVSHIANVVPAVTNGDMIELLCQSKVGKEFVLATILSSIDFNRCSTFINLDIRVDLVSSVVPKNAIDLLALGFIVEAEKFKRLVDVWLYKGVYSFFLLTV